MRYTVFNTPGVRHILYISSVIFLKITGWRKEGNMPDIPKYVVAGAFHTSNWDLPFGIALACLLDINMSWIGKDSLFRGPLNWFFRWLGGIPVDRSKSSNAVAQMVEIMNKADRMVLVIAPEGTRSKAKRWKTGFYRIAQGAGVPIVLGYLDYKRRVGGPGPMFMPSGDMEADLKIMRDFFSTVTAKYPQDATPPTFETQGEQPEERNADVH